MTRRLLPVALVLAALAVLGFAGPAGASSAPAVSTAQSALNGATNDGCFSCHGVRGKTPSITVGSEQKSTYVDRARYDASRHGKLACTSCHLGFKPGIHDAEPDHRLADDGEAHGVRRLPRRPVRHVPRLLPREPRVRALQRQGSGLRRLPHAARHPHAGHGRLPPERARALRALPRAGREDLPQQLPRQGLLSRPPERRRLPRLPRRPQDPPALQPGEHRLLPEHRGHVLQVPPGREPQLRRASSCTSTPAAPGPRSGCGASTSST